MELRFAHSVPGDVGLSTLDGFSEALIAGFESTILKLSHAFLGPLKNLLILGETIGHAFNVKIFVLIVLSWLTTRFLGLQLSLHILLQLG